MLAMKKSQNDLYIQLYIQRDIEKNIIYTQAEKHHYDVYLIDTYL